MLSQLAPAAVANAKREAADIQALIDAQAKANGSRSFKLEPWDWDFYAEQVRKAQYSYDESAGAAVLRDEPRAASTACCSPRTSCTA